MKQPPLATQVRPQSLKDVIGQTHLLNETGLIARIVKANKPQSLIFYGKPGIGKTTIALALANDLNIPYQTFNAAQDNKERLIEILKVAEISERYIIIVDEIHRLNRDKQDVLLHALEAGQIVMFASTTENPFFVVNPAIRSRCQIAQLKPLTSNDVFVGLQHLVQKLNIKNLDVVALKYIADKTQGDLRASINIIDAIANLYTDVSLVTPELLAQIMNETYVDNSHYNDEHHDLKSALHKSVRGSDVNASLHYLARLMIGHDLVAISRRLIMIAYEDIGLANPNLCMRVYLGVQAAKEVGFPEAYTILGDLIIEMALSPKSNAGYRAISQAMVDAQSGKAFTIPAHLRDNNYASHTKLGVKGYKYPHNFKNAWVEQQYLPDELIHAQYYEPPPHSINEAKLGMWLKSLQRYKED